MVTVIGTRTDGSLLGEDENGNLYVGVDRQAPWSEVTRTITVGEDETLVEFHIGEHLVGKATLAPDTEVGEYTDGQEQYVGGQVATLRVTDWTVI